MCEAEVIWSELVSRWPEVKPFVLACTSLQPVRFPLTFSMEGMPIEHLHMA